jgi:two-component system sensor histidine kinase BaeS
VSLRRRLTIAFTAMSLAVLILAGLFLVVLARSTARDNARDELRDTASALADVYQEIGDSATVVTGTRGGTNVRFADVVCLTEPAFQVEAIGLTLVQADGQIRELQLTNLPARCAENRKQLQTNGLPSGVELSDLDGPTLAAGQSIQGSRGRLVFIAQPIGTVGAAGRTTIVAVLTRDLGPANLGRFGGLVLISALIALGVAVVGSAVLARRLSRPLAAIEEAARAIGDGDLSARVGTIAHADAEIARLAETIDGMAAQLDRARGSERAFLMSVSHDLRTPLTSIRGYAEAMADGALDADDPHERERAAGVIAAEARRLERLVRDLLDLARLEADQFSLRPQAADATAVVADAAEALRLAAEDAGLRLVVTTDGPLPGLLDPERLGQIVANLTENAIKYATDEVRVTVRSSPPGAFRLEVADDGPGIPPEDLPHVFDRLYTSRRVPGRRVGTGLGLTIVRELAHAMRGTVHLDASPGGGTVVVVHLPLTGPDPNTGAGAGTREAATR